MTAYQLVCGTRSLQSSATVKATLTGLAKGAKMRVGVRALNALGWSAYGYSAYVTTEEVTTPSSTPVDTGRAVTATFSPMVLDSEQRPWGSWHVIDVADGYKIKRIHVNPGARLSLQSHEHRSEHWVVIQGVADL